MEKIHRLKYHTCKWAQYDYSSRKVKKRFDMTNKNEDHYKIHE